jgi:hypothetical protein
MHRPHAPLARTRDRTPLTRATPLLHCTVPIQSVPMAAPDESTLASMCCYQSQAANPHIVYSHLPLRDLSAGLEALPFAHTMAIMYMRLALPPHGPSCLSLPARHVVFHGEWVVVGLPPQSILFLDCGGEFLGLRRWLESAVCFSNTSSVWQCTVCVITLYPRETIAERIR